MRGSNRARLDGRQTRQALVLGLANAALWSIGNGLTTGTLVTYLALDLGASGRELSLILAAPMLVGLLRVLAPPLIDRLGGLKRATLALSLGSYLLIWGLPAVGIPHGLPPRLTLGLLVLLLCAHQLLEYLASAALFSWLGDLVPPRIRGRYFARRQIVQLAVLVPTLLLGGWFSSTWKQQHAETAPGGALLAYAIPNAVGAAALMLSLAPLVRMPAPRAEKSVLRGPGLRALAAPLADRRYWPLLAYGCWFSCFNGLLQVPQNVYPKQVLLLGVGTMSAMRVTMQLGQIGLAQWAGGFSDRFGNRPVLIASQLVLVLAPLCFWLATPAHPGWMVGAYLAWTAYAGVNLCVPNLLLVYSQPENRAAYVSSYWGISGVCYAGSTLASGWLFDWLGPGQLALPWGGQCDRYDLAFLSGIAARALAIGWLLLLVEPRARTWRTLARERVLAKTSPGA